MSDSVITATERRLIAAARRHSQVAQRRRLDASHAQRLDALQGHPNAPEPATLSVREFSVATGLSAATVHRHVASGLIKSIKLAGRRLIAYAEIKRLQGEAAAEGRP